VKACPLSDAAAADPFGNPLGSGTNFTGNARQRAFHENFMMEE